MEKRYPLPPFNRETAMQKVQLAEDSWNSKDPGLVSMAYTMDSKWRNRSVFISGRAEIVAFLTAKWQRELNYKLKKELFAFMDDRIAVRFEYEYQDSEGNWFRAYGNENWIFDQNGLMKERYASINDVAIDASERYLSV